MCYSDKMKYKWLTIFCLIAGFGSATLALTLSVSNRNTALFFSVFVLALASGWLAVLDKSSKDPKERQIIGHTFKKALLGYIFIISIIALILFYLTAAASSL